MFGDRVEPLSPIEVRVLGSLVEKEVTTPEYYPLTLNALVNACNQKSNREPVVAYNDEIVSEALAGLRQKKLSTVITGVSIRVPKHTHRFAEALNLGRRELALMCVLMLRGPQTVGELRDRSERMHRFEDMDEVESCLGRLAEWEPQPLTVRLPRQPGMKEPRWAHLLCGPVDVSALEAASHEPVAPSRVAADDRVSALEGEVAALRLEVDSLKQQFTEFRKQFE